MSTPTMTPYRSAAKPGRDGFAQLVRAEWTKFRTVRGWMIALIAAAVLSALAVVALAGIAKAGFGKPFEDTANDVAGQAVTDEFYFVHQPLAGNGSITVRVSSLTGIVNGGPDIPGQGQPQPWAKAGLIIKTSTKPGSSYAAIMATPAHGVRMQYDFSNDIAGMPGAVSASSPRWLRLTRSGDTITGYDSADGRFWSKVGTVRLRGLPATVQAGLFVTSPQDDVTLLHSQEFARGNTGGPLPTLATGNFDQLTRAGTWPARAWTGTSIGRPPGTPRIRTCSTPTGHDCTPIAAYSGGYHASGGSFTVSGSGDIAPAVPIVDPLGTVFKGSLIGLIAIIAVAVLFMTAEYRRGMIRTTFTTSPRRGRVLAAKALVIGAVAFVSGLVGAAFALPIAEHKLQANGWVTSIYHTVSEGSGPGFQIVVGTAALVAMAAIIAMSVGAVLRRSAGAITAVIILLIGPLLLASVVNSPTGDWVLRLTPAAAFGLQQGTQRYPQVTTACLPHHGCYPLAPWNGFLVMCAWAAGLLVLAVVAVRRRDA
jgi:ABC-2 family transporter protein